MNRFGRYLMLCLAALLAGCASNQPAPVIERVAPTTTLEGPGAQAASAPAGYYIVKKGDTLYSIALDHGCSYRDIATWNGLSDPNKIAVGQQLRVVPPEAAAAPSEAAGGAEVRPVAAPAQVEAQPLAATGAPAAAPPATTPADTATLKRGPIGGEQPYSEAALAQLQKADAAPSPPPPTVQAAAPAAAPAPAPAGQAANEDGVDWGWPAGGKVIAGFVEGANKGIDIAAKVGDPVLAAAAGKVVYAGTGLRGYGKLVIVKHNALFLSAYAHNSQILVKEGQSVTKGQEIAEAGSTDSDRPMLHFEIRRQGKPVDPLKHLPSR